MRDDQEAHLFRHAPVSLPIRGLQGNCYFLHLLILFSYFFLIPTLFCDVVTIYINPCHVVGYKHTVYFARNKIKGADVVGSINHVTFLTNRFPKVISLPLSTIFVSGTSESVSCFLECSCVAAILKI